MSRDLPIIFSGPMVQGLWFGRKTMTRRVIKPQPDPFLVDEKPVAVTLMQVEGDPRPRVALGCVITKQEIKHAPGDRLWVRENFAHVGTCDPGFLTYQATYPEDLAHLGLEKVPATLKEAGYKWTPCIHMPRALSRLTLIVTAVKIERLQDISEADALAEGVVEDDGDTPNIFYLPGSWRLGGVDHGDRPTKVFRSLWERLHGEGAWSANPFVVATSFRVIKANIDAPEARIAA